MSYLADKAMLDFPEMRGSEPTNVASRQCRPPPNSNSNSVLALGGALLLAAFFPLNLPVAATILLVVAGSLLDALKSHSDFLTGQKDALDARSTCAVR